MARPTPRIRGPPVAGARAQWPGVMRAQGARARGGPMPDASNLS